jgi:gamma-glutamyl hercynylcysteine S-oxide synthase
MGLALLSRKKHRQAGTSRGCPAYLKQANYQPAEVLKLDPDALRRHLQLERYGIIVRSRSHWRDHPMVEAVFQSAIEAIDGQFALVPEGFASLSLAVMDFPGSPETDVETNAFLLARTCITQAQFQKFVDSGGYEDLQFWPEDIWPHLIDFIDLTGKPGPRYWRDGRHDKRYAQHPVIGICCYEAAAYAAWAGYRLPSGAEWQMAASWRIRSSANVLRRYPWGDALDTSKCNIWASAIGGTVPVDEYESGAAPNGVLQLIGNVWEWTSSDYEITDDAGRQVVGDMVMKEVRGGSFDTYFPNQATSCFRTGLASLARMHNVGFRCIVDLSPSESKDNGHPPAPPASPVTTPAPASTQGSGASSAERRLT